VTSVYTPLRYPGGKSKLGPYLTYVMRANRLVGAAYAEPYAGGAGAGLYLLFRGYASHLYLNDIDRGVTSFWRAVLGSRNEEFARAIETVPLSVAEWDRQKDILHTSRPGFRKGFAFFYLNRTNRSGIMNAGVIGGRDQTGAWGIEARFNRTTLAARIRSLAVFRNRISVSSLDALDFLDQVSSDDFPILTYLDPPYYDKGQRLYTNFYSPDDHRAIAGYLQSYRNPWLLTYDACEEVRALYRDRVVLESELSYSAREVRRGKEVVIFGPGLKPPTKPKDSLFRGRRRAGFELT
jgi:DNA adenine methylase